MALAYYKAWANDRWDEAWYVALDWDDAPESDLSHYNVYRADVSGGPYTKINASPVLTSTYADTGVEEGESYCYVVTAVDEHGAESAYSTEDCVTVGEAGLESVRLVGMVGISGER